MAFACVSSLTAWMLACFVCLNSFAIRRIMWLHESFLGLCSNFIPLVFIIISIVCAYLTEPCHISSKWFSAAQCSSATLAAECSSASGCRKSFSGLVLRLLCLVPGVQIQNLFIMRTQPIIEIQQLHSVLLLSTSYTWNPAPPTLSPFIRPWNKLCHWFGKGRKVFTASLWDRVFLIR